MAHFAELDGNNIVLRALVVPDSEEHRGEDYLANEIGLGGRWIQTSINNRIRGVFAVPGAEYLPDLDKFMPLKPERNPSFIFDEEQWKWVYPIAEPEDADWVIGGAKQPEFEDVEIEIEGKLRQAKKPILPEDPKIYTWDEDSVSWKLQPKPTPPPTPEELEAMKAEQGTIEP